MHAHSGQQKRVWHLGALEFPFSIFHYLEKKRIGIQTAPDLHQQQQQQQL